MYTQLSAFRGPAPARTAPETGGVTRIRRGNRPPRDAPRAPRRHRGPVRPVSAVCARFPRVRASNASCNGVVGCGATGEVAGSAARGSATRTSRRSPLPEPAGRAGKEPGGGVPPRGPVERRRRSAIISHRRRRGGCARSSGAAPAAVVVSRRVPCFSDPHARTGAQALRGAPLARGLSPSPRTPYSVRTSQYTARHYNTCGDARVVHWLHAAHHACPLDCPHPWLAQTSSSLILVDVGAGFMSFMPQ